jgi:hypothetical protein
MYCRHRFDTIPEPDLDLDRHQNGNSYPDWDPDRHQNDANPQHGFKLRLKFVLCKDLIYIILNLVIWCTINKCWNFIWSNFPNL